MGFEVRNGPPDPDWASQADQQLSDLYRTLHEIGDPYLFEVWEVMEDALNSYVPRVIQQAGEDG